MCSELCCAPSRQKLDAVGDEIKEKFRALEEEYR